MANSNPAADNKSQSGTEPSPSLPTQSSLSNWEKAQESLKKKLITEEDGCLGTGVDEEGEALKYVGGVDISFSKGDPSLACGTLVVLELHSLRLVYEDFSLVTLNVPYVPGFLAFREVRGPSASRAFGENEKHRQPFLPTGSNGRWKWGTSSSSCIMWMVLHCLE